jgi:hypothetical protein
VLHAQAEIEKSVQDFTEAEVETQIGARTWRIYEVLDPTHVQIWIHCTGIRYFRASDDAEPGLG